MKKKKHYAVWGLLLCCALWFGSMGIVFAADPASATTPASGASVQLPDATLFKPPVDQATGSMTGLIKLINYIIAIFGVYLLFHAVFGAFKHAKDLIKGESWKGLIMQRFQSLGIGLFVVLLGITGAWYQVLVFLGKVFQGGINMFAG